MATEMHVLFRGPLPSKAALTRAIKELGFPLTITSKGSLDQQSGFMPMRLQREDSGVEFDVFDGRNAVEELAGGDVDPSLDRVASFRWGGAEDEMLCAMCSAAALAKLTSGLVFEEAEVQLMAPDAAVRFAAQHLEIMLKPQARLRGTRPADLKHYLQPLLKLRSDLVLIDRMLLMRPVRHILRRVYLDRAADKHRLNVSACGTALYDDRSARAFELPNDLWEVWQPHFAPMLMDVLGQDVFPKLGSLTTLPELGSVTACILGGEREQAETLVADVERSDPEGRREWTTAMRAFLERDIDDICREYHAREAAAAAALKLGDAWEPTPFPVELPRGSRHRCAEPPFSRAPWVKRPSSLLQDLPDTPGEMRFAKTRLERDDGVELVAPLTSDEAKMRHEGGEPYVLAARLRFLVLLADHSGADRRDPAWPDHDVSYPRNLRIQVHGAKHIAHAWFSEHWDHRGTLRLRTCGVRERTTKSEVWHSHFGDELSIHDDRSGSRRYSRRLPTNAEHSIGVASAPAFGEVEPLVTRTLDWLRAMGYGEFT